MKTVSMLAGALVAAAAFGAPALADPEWLVAGPEAQMPPQAATAAEGRVLMDEDKLGQLSAGDSNTYQVLAGQQLTATAEGNTINGDVNTGDVVFGAEALNGFSGVGNFVANTGANSNLNGSIMVNIVGASVNP